MQVEYLEVVTPNVAETCAAYTKLYDICFSEAIEELGNAFVAALANGGRISIRAPMHESEQPVVRPYMLVDNLDKAVTELVSAGAEIIHPATHIPNQGHFAIYLLAGLQFGLWQK